VFFVWMLEGITSKGMPHVEHGTVHTTNGTSRSCECRNEGVVFPSVADEAFVVTTSLAVHVLRHQQDAGDRSSELVLEVVEVFRVSNVRWSFKKTDGLRFGQVVIRRVGQHPRHRSNKC